MTMTKPLSPEAWAAYGICNKDHYAFIEQQLWLAQYYFTRGFQPSGIAQPPKKPLKTLKAVLKRAIRVEKGVVKVWKRSGWDHLEIRYKFNDTQRKKEWEDVKYWFNKLFEAENYNQYVERIKRGEFDDNLDFFIANKEGH